MINLKEIKLKTAELAKELGYNETCHCFYNFLLKNNAKVHNTHKNSEDINICSAPFQDELKTWLRTEYNIELYVIPIFGNKCGYDSFVNKGYSFDILFKSECMFITWATLNSCWEDYDEGIKEYINENDRALNPIFNKFEDALENGLYQSLKILKNINNGKNNSN